MFKFLKFKLNFKLIEIKNMNKWKNYKINFMKQD